MTTILRSCTVLMFALVATSALGQFGLGQFGFSGGGSEGLAASGTVSVRLQPKFLQVSIQVEGRSSDLPQAVGELKKRIKIAQERLKQLKAIESSVALSKPELQGAGSADNSKKMQAMMQQYGGGKQGREMLEKTNSVSIVQTLTARWALKGDDDLDRLVSVHELTQQIESKDIASSGEKQPISAAQEELAVEMAQMMEDRSYGEETTKTGQPTFTFVAVLSAKDYASAVGDAYKKATQQIALLAKATGTKVEAAKPKTATIPIKGGNGYGRYGGASAAAPEQDDESGDYELEADNPIDASCTVVVTAIAKHVRAD